MLALAMRLLIHAVEERAHGIATLLDRRFLSQWEILPIAYADLFDQLLFGRVSLVGELHLLKRVSARDDPLGLAWLA